MTSLSADQLQLKLLVESDDDVDSGQHGSILSFESVGSSCSAHMEQATPLESSTGTHSSVLRSAVVTLCTHVRVGLCLCVCVYVYVCTWMCMCACVCACMCVCVHVCVSACMHSRVCQPVSLTMFNFMLPLGSVLKTATTILVCLAYYCSVFVDSIEQRSPF